MTAQLTLFRPGDAADDLAERCEALLDRIGPGPLTMAQRAEALDILQEVERRLMGAEHGQDSGTHVAGPGRRVVS